MRLSLNYLWDNFSRSESDPLVAGLHTSSNSKQTKKSLEADEKTFGIRGKVMQISHLITLARPANPQVVSDFDHEVTKHTSIVWGLYSSTTASTSPRQFSIFNSLLISCYSADKIHELGSRDRSVEMVAGKIANTTTTQRHHVWMFD